MALPGQTFTIQDGALGLVGSLAQAPHAKIGISSAGVANEVQSFADIKALKDALGQGPLVEAAAIALRDGGSPVLCVRATQSAAGAAGAVTTVQTGTATLAVTVATAYDTYSVVIEIIDGGATLVAGTATFRYSLDGGKTWSDETAVPTSGVFAIPNSGLTVTWTYAAGTAFVTGDKWSFSTTAPTFDTTSLNTAMDALNASQLAWKFVHVVGPASTVAGAAGVAAALDTKLTSAFNAYRFARGLIECPEDTDANVLTGFAAFSSTRVAVAVGFVDILNAVGSPGGSFGGGRKEKRSIAWAAAARASKAEPHHDLGRFASGALPGVLKLYRDEAVTPGLDDANFITARTHYGVSGYFLTGGHFKAAPGSDFRDWQNGMVIDLAADTVRKAALKYQSESVRVAASTGFILEADAKAIEAYVGGLLRSSVTRPGYASDVSVVVSRTENILSSQKLPFTVRVIPNGLAKFIAIDLGYRNPALEQVAA